MMKGSTLGDSRICLFTHATANHQNHLTFQVQLTLTRFPVILAAATGHYFAHLVVSKTTGIENERGRDYSNPVSSCRNKNPSSILASGTGSENPHPYSNVLALLSFKHYWVVIAPIRAGTFPIHLQDALQSRVDKK